MSALQVVRMDVPGKSPMWVGLDVQYNALLERWPIYMGLAMDAAMRRFFSCDWGLVLPVVAAANEKKLKAGGLGMSAAYRLEMIGHTMSFMTALFHDEPIILVTVFSNCSETVHHVMLPPTEFSFLNCAR